jgi:hypothetical protein
VRAWTTAGWFLLLFGGCGRGAVPAAPAEPSPDPPRPPVVWDGGHGMRLCVLEGGRLREVPITFNMTTRDSLYEGRPFRERFGDTREYAASRRWFVDSAPLLFAERRYVRYGLPRVLSVHEVEPTGEYDGVLLFAEARTEGPPDVLYVPVRAGCVFQPYLWDLHVEGVRGTM